MRAAETSLSLSVVMPTFNNLAVLQQAVESWRTFGGADYELLVVEDGCRDGTAAWLARVQQTVWGRRHLRWFHEDDAHELVCTNRGLREARGALVAAFQDDMFLQAHWFVPEVIGAFVVYPKLGLLSLSRGLRCRACADPITRWEDLFDWRRLESTIGPSPRNWFALQEVDAVIRPWVVRRTCLDHVGLLDEAYRPTEWDEADLAFRIRDAGWFVATHGYERLGAYRHLGSTTIGAPSEAYKARVLANGRRFHERWDAVIAREDSRPRRRWPRVASGSGWAWTLAAATRASLPRVGRRA